MCLILALRCFNFPWEGITAQSYVNIHLFKQRLSLEASLLHRLVCGKVWGSKLQIHHRCVHGTLVCYKWTQILLTQGCLCWRSHHGPSVLPVTPHLVYPGRGVCGEGAGRRGGVLIIQLSNKSGMNDRRNRGGFQNCPSGRDFSGSSGLLHHRLLIKLTHWSFAWHKQTRS